MQHNQLHGRVPPGPWNLPMLTKYNIGHNNIVSAPESIGNLSKILRIMFMGSNRISGSIPSSIVQLKSLALLNLGYNFISGQIPPELGQLEDLQKLVLGNNRFTSYIPSSLGNLRKLTKIDLSSNELGGNIPISFTNFKWLTSMDLSMNKLNGSKPREVLNLPSLTIILNLSSNLLTGYLPREIHSLEKVVTIDLSNNNLLGEIPNSIQNCKSLEQLIISKNSLSGNIPNSLGELRGLLVLDLSSNQLFGPIPLELQSLNAIKILNLSFNNLEGNFLSNGFFSNLTKVHLEGNPKLCYDSKCTRGETSKAIVTVVLVISSVLATFISIALFFTFRKTNFVILESPDSFKCRHQMVTYNQLRCATGNFNDENLIGYGGFGSIYKGHLNLKGRSQEIAVKVLDMETTGSLPSFMAECAALRYLRHRNLVKLITSCSSLDPKNKEFRALVYEYMKNRSLESWIGKEMGFQERLNVAIDVACGLTYLHHECVVAPVVHCDLKPSNVLLDEDFTAKIGDFGLASILVEKDQYVDVLKGSMGYIPPEYGMGAKPSTKGDVYNYGIMLMEIFTGKRPTDDIFVGGLSLKIWVQSAFPSSLDLVLDPYLIQELKELWSKELGLEELYSDGRSMNQKRPYDCLIIIIGVALSCTNDSPEGRIIISEALRKLKSVQGMLRKS
ncbi:unnamed protein product [Lactuca saligna]|uniref:non-specific serine/threonine protein kinase n=1 Tax=Lactuca saligna TaxID=75948 RepID=A0AA35Y6A5_LACSI|nr:unnamed protein product [Lactuca saligna]